MKRIIVNADDFGINETVTSEIERVINQGLVSSTTVMANGACLDEVKQFAGEHPEVSFGVHLCLSEFGSLTKSEGLYKAGLTDENGQFVRKAVFGLKNLGRPEVQKAIKDELNAQIDVVGSLGFPISHADSHHHVHGIYPLRHIIADALKSRGIDKLRLCMGFNTLRSKIRFTKYLRHVNLNLFYRSRFVTSDGFYPYSMFVATGVSLREDQTVELMCHPGHPAERYRDEMALVEAKIAIPEGVQMISYNGLENR